MRTRGIEYIVLHHTATGATLKNSDKDGELLWEAIKKYHQKKYKKFDPDYLISYHFGVTKTGKILEGERVEKFTFHCGNSSINKKSIAIAFLGNFEKNRMEESQFFAGVDLIKWLAIKNDIDLNNVLRHKDIVNDLLKKKNVTLCPGKFFPFDEILRRI